MTLLTVSARGFPALTPLNQNHCSCKQNHRSHKAEWFQGKSKPMEHEEVAEAHGYGWNDNDEESAIQDENFPANF
jgi:hypothetical protein